ncbi:hypothetical protein NIES21_22700 [Anabaenopsis circularis NIES-21]|uniref:Uncharacterized protein n=1 Tax=Anabaenopsis circularis NIES-21 TaxID=1085406 RepID=A0A1Z4GG16_9CYAN|nr:hypothetical protein NIES21_22700 [Anabaenopsis circularis NIES-21]
MLSFCYLSLNIENILIILRIAQDKSKFNFQIMYIATLLINFRLILTQRLFIKDK